MILSADHFLYATIGYMMVSVTGNVICLGLFYLLHEFTNSNPKLRSITGNLMIISCGVQMILLNILSIWITNIDSLCLYMFVSCIVCTLSSFFLFESPLFLIKKGWISNFMKTSYQIHKGNNELHKQELISEMVDPHKLTTTCRSVRVSKNLVLKEQLKIPFKAFCSIKEAKRLLILGFQNSAMYMVFYEVIFSVQDVGLKNPSYTGILLGICTAFSPFLT
jgi:hypothetical protein